MSVKVTRQSWVSRLTESIKSAVFGDVVSLFGRMLGAGVGLVAGFLAACFALVTIAVAWMTYRPALGVVLLALAAGALFLLVRVSKKRAAAAGPPPLPLPVDAG